MRGELPLYLGFLLASPLNVDGEKSSGETKTAAVAPSTGNQYAAYIPTLNDVENHNSIGSTLGDVGDLAKTAAVFI